MPRIACSGCSRRCRARDRAAAAPRVYGCCGRGEDRLRPAPRSTIRPAYITATSSTISATTPRSCVMSRIAMPEPLAAAPAAARGSAPGSSRRARSSARRRSAASGRRRAPSRSSRAAACRRTAGAGSRATRCSGDGMPTSSQHLDRRGRAASVRPTPLVEPHRLGDLVADREDRVERRHRLLEDHRDLVAADLAHLVVAAASSRSRPSKTIAARLRCGRAGRSAA